MEFQELQLLVPEVLSRIGVEHDPPLSTSDGMVWLVRPNDTLGAVLVREEWRPHIVIKAGVVLHVPFTPELAYHVANYNRMLFTGRLYLRHNPQENVGLALLQDTVFGSALAADQSPGIEDLAWRIDWLMTVAGALSQDVIAEYGGQPFASNDAVFLDIEAP